MTSETALGTADSPLGGPFPTASSVASQTLEEKVLQILEEDNRGSCELGAHVRSWLWAPEHAT